MSQNLTKEKPGIVALRNKNEITIASATAASPLKGEFLALLKNKKDVFIYRIPKSVVQVKSVIKVYRTSPDVEDAAGIITFGHVGYEEFPHRRDNWQEGLDIIRSKVKMDRTVLDSYIEWNYDGALRVVFKSDMEKTYSELIFERTDKPSIGDFEIRLEPVSSAVKVNEEVVVKSFNLLKEKLKGTDWKSIRGDADPNKGVWKITVDRALGHGLVDITGPNVKTAYDKWTLIMKYNRVSGKIEIDFSSAYDHNKMPTHIDISNIEAAISRFNALISPASSAVVADGWNEIISPAFLSTIDKLGQLPGNANFRLYGDKKKVLVISFRDSTADTSRSFTLQIDEQGKMDVSWRYSYILDPEWGSREVLEEEYSLKELVGKLKIEVSKEKTILTISPEAHAELLSSVFKTKEIIDSKGGYESYLLITSALAFSAVQVLPAKELKTQHDRINHLDQVIGGVGKQIEAFERDGFVDQPKFDGLTKDFVNTYKDLLKLITEAEKWEKDEGVKNPKNAQELSTKIAELRRLQGSEKIFLASLELKEKASSAVETGGIDLVSMKLEIEKARSLPDAQKVSSAVELQSLYAAYALSGLKWEGLAGLYFYQIMLMVKDGIAKDLTIEARNRLIMVGEKLKLNGYLGNNQSLNFFNQLKLNMSLGQMKVGMP